MAYQKRNIEQFLLSRGWQHQSTGQLFEYFKPPKSLHLGDDYLLEIANDDTKPGFQRYTESLIDVIFDVYDGDIVEDDLMTFFSSEETILSLRIADEDTRSGSIQLERLSKAIDNLKLVFKQTVTFLMTSKAIFGESRSLADSYIKSCRALQTDIGSYITKVQLPAHSIGSLLENLNTPQVPNKLYEILDFTDREILHPTVSINSIDKSYFEEYKSLLNVELLTSIKDMCYQSNLNHFDFQFDNFSMSKIVEFEGVKPHLSYFNSYIKKLKNILLEESPLEFIGVIRKLSSYSPKQSNSNEVIIEGEISNNKERVKVILNKEDYNSAIEAHKNESKVRVKGIAKEYQTQYSIIQPELFEVISSESE